MAENLTDVVARLLHRMDCEAEAPHSEPPSLYERWWHEEADQEVYVSRALRILAALASEAPGWRPIETAPRDGTIVLAVPYALAAYSWQFHRWQDESGFEITPTHWMPLPPEPKP